MRWPWETIKPVHDPTRNYDIHIVDIVQTWIHPAIPTYKIPDSLFCQLLSARIYIQCSVGIRAVGGINLTTTHNNRISSISATWLTISSGSSYEITFNSNQTLTAKSWISGTIPANLPDNIFLFPNDSIYFTIGEPLNGDRYSKISFTFKRWEYY